MFCNNDATDSTDSCGFSVSVIYSYHVHDEEFYEDDLWMIIDCREWREYLKALWLEVLKLKQYFTSQYWECRLYHKKLLNHISGWLARKGCDNKKN